MRSQRARSFLKPRDRTCEALSAVPRIGSLLIVAVAAILLSAAATQAMQKEERRESAPATTAVAPPTLPPFMSPLHPSSSSDVDSNPRSSVFAVDLTAQDGLETLWRESIRVKEERVACIAGHMEGDAFHVTRVRPVPTEKADSLRVSPGPSLEMCGPPEWIGTVHTHIATFRGQPFATLSPSDRAVMNVWRLKWKQEGVFCVLYTETEAYCEYGTELHDDVEYLPEGRDGRR